MDFFSDLWQNETSNRARFNGTINLFELRHILANDEQYNSEILFQLWDTIGLNDEKIKFTEVKLPEHRNLSNKPDMATVWYFILARLARTAEGDFYYVTNRSVT